MKEKTKRKWYVVGYLAGRERVFCSAAGGLAKEVDYEFLVEMTDEELRQILPEKEGNYGA